MFRRLACVVRREYAAPQSMLRWIEAGEREMANEGAKPPAAVKKPPKASSRPAARNERVVQKEMKTLERTIGQLDEQKRALNAQLQISTDAVEALRLHHEVSAVTEQLAEAEERWCRLQEEIDGAA